MNFVVFALWYSGGRGQRETLTAAAVDIHGVAIGIGGAARSCVIAAAAAAAASSGSFCLGLVRIGRPARGGFVRTGRQSEQTDKDKLLPHHESSMPSLAAIGDRFIPDPARDIADAD
jgi:hypothetical protein